MVLSEEEVEEHRVQGHCVALYDEYLSEVLTMGMLDEPSSIDRPRPRFDPILLRPIDELELPMHASQALGAAQVSRVGDLVQLTESDLLAINGLTPNCIETIKDTLASRGLDLGVHLDGWTDES